MIGVAATIAAPTIVKTLLVDYLVHNDLIKPTKSHAMKHRILFSLGLALCIVQAARSDSTLEYLVVEDDSKPGKIQPVIIKDGKILVKAVGGDGNMDIIYSAAPGMLFIVDHGKRSVMTLDDAQVNRISKQTEAVQPLLQGFGEQLAKLDPKQRTKWEAMLGGKISLDKIAEAAKPVQTAKIVKSGQTRKVAGIACEQMNVFQDKKKSAEFCMADPAKLNLSGQDYATIRSLLGFLERLSSKTQGLAKQFGINLPDIDFSDVSGVPIQLRDVSSHNQGSLTMKGIEASTVSADVMKIPDGYQYGPFKLWK
jgi:hypothetical protein